MSVISEVFDFYYSFQGEKGFIGKTEQNRPIPFIKVGKGLPVIIASYAIHAREYITSYLAIEQIKRFNAQNFGGTVYFLPMINIDGVKICLDTKPLYKANANGVDLNVNFDARWGKGKSNTTKKGDQNYIGEKPFSARETRALRDFTLKVKPNLTLSYHSKGEEIYWEFFQGAEAYKRDKKIAKAASKETGYKLKTVLDSAGGYKDWCIEKLKIPALTIEIGSDKLSHPIGKENLKTIDIQNATLIIRLIAELKRN